MRRVFREIRSDQFCFWGAVLSLIFTALNFSFLIFSLSKLPPEVPLFYSRPWGEEQLGQWWQLFFLPGSSLILFLINTSLAVKIYSREKNLSQIIIGSQVIISLLATIACYQIVKLVI